jgi:hypothetical protein
MPAERSIGHRCAVRANPQAYTGIAGSAPETGMMRTYLLNTVAALQSSLYE